MQREKDMKVYVPNYYKKFKCTADKCSHNCCIGWEIDIDADTYKKYMNTGGEFGKRLRRGISYNGESASFILARSERCPFLNSDNLCDIILNLGEDSLCEICAMHPRYRNFFGTREERGLGLCCEAAARLILTEDKKIRLEEAECAAEDNREESIDEEQMFLSLRDGILEVLQNRILSIDDRIEKLFEDYGIDLPDRTLGEWSEIYLGLERLDEKWTEYLKKLKGKDFVVCDMSEGAAANALEQILVYFILRHLSDGIYDGRLYERAAFAILSLRIICAVCVYSISEDTEVSVDGLIETARLYSLEIEYSDENIEKLLESLAEQVL